MVKWFNKYMKDPKREPVLVDYVRTPLGSNRGTLKRLRGDDMFIHTIKTLVDRNEAIPVDDYGDVIAGCNSQIGACALDIAKTAALAAHLPMHIPGVSINRQCASGMQACYFAWMSIATGEKDVVLAGGVESQNTYPIMADMNVAMGGTKVQTFPPNPRISTNPYIKESEKKYNGEMSGQINSAEIMGNVWQEKSGLERSEFRRQLDEIAMLSHKKAGETWDQRAEEIEPIKVPKLDENGKPIVQRNGMLIEGETEITSRDESPRPVPEKTNMKKLGRLRGIVKRKTGLLTAGNSCPTSDGAAATIWTSRGYAEEHGLKIRASLDSCYACGTDAVLMLTGPIEAAPVALKRAELTMDDMSVIEINEAFSTVVWASCDGLGLDYKDPRLNPLGGAISIGHPTGATGCRLIGTITHQLEASQKSYGIGTLCVGLGMGIAAVVRREGG